MTQLKKELQLRITHYESMTGSQKYGSQLEQNAVHVVLHELKYLDSITEFDNLPTESQSDKNQDNPSESA